MNRYIAVSIIFLFFAFTLFSVGLIFLAKDSFLFGDAYNFVNYRENIINGYYQLDLGTVNVIGPSLLYSSDPIRNFVINIIYFSILISFCFAKIDVGDQLNILVIILVITYMGTVSKLFEPSREYILNLTMFAVGICGGKDRFHWKLLFLLIAFFMRPVFIVSLPFIFFKNYVLIIYVFMIFAMLNLFDIKFIQIFTDRIGDYKGHYGGNLILVTTLNLFGGLNGWVTDIYSNSTRIFFFLEYVGRLALLAILVVYKWSVFNKLLIFGVLLAVLLKFPHPRYMEPMLNYCAGLLLFKRSYEQHR